LLEENKSNPAEFLLGDYTTFKVVVQNADVIEKGTDVTVKAPAVILNSTESGTNVTNNVTNGMKRNNSGTTAEQSGTMSGTIRNNDDSLDNIQDLVLNQIRKDKRISIKQLSKMFNKTRASMFRIIEKLKADGRLRRVGSLKSGTWEVIE
ncbi:helix-turn-helix domain-containing protein, partial [uncultured Muribaculum sp.]